MQQQSNTLYKEILGGKDYYGSMTCKTVFQCCNAILSILSCSSCCYSSSLHFGLTLSLRQAVSLHLRQPVSHLPVLLFVVLSPYSLQPVSSSLSSLLLAFLLIQSVHVHPHRASTRAETHTARTSTHVCLSTTCESHACVCYLTFDLYCIQLLKEYW